MGKIDKLKQRILDGTSDTNIDFRPLCTLLTNLDFEERIKGNHHTRVDVEEIINIQPIGSKAKPYQVKQIRKLIAKHHLGDQDVE